MKDYDEIDFKYDLIDEGAVFFSLLDHYGIIYHFMKKGEMVNIKE